MSFDVTMKNLQIVNVFDRQNLVDKMDAENSTCVLNHCATYGLIRPDTRLPQSRAGAILEVSGAFGQDQHAQKPPKRQKCDGRTTDGLMDGPTMRV